MAREDKTRQLKRTETRAGCVWASEGALIVQACPFIDPGAEPRQGSTHPSSLDPLRCCSNCLTTRPCAAPSLFLMTMSFVNWLGFAAWQALLNNFVVERAGFQWAEIGLTKSVREIPGFFAFTAIFWLALMREQTLAYVSLLLLGFGVTVDRFFSNPDAAC